MEGVTHCVQVHYWQLSEKVSNTMRYIEPMPLKMDRTKVIAVFALPEPYCSKKACHRADACKVQEGQDAEQSKRAKDVL